MGQSCEFRIENTMNAVLVARIDGFKNTHHGNDSEIASLTIYGCFPLPLPTWPVGVTPLTNSWGESDRISELW